MPSAALRDFGSQASDLEWAGKDSEPSVASNGSNRKAESRNKLHWHQLSKRTQPHYFFWTERRDDARIARNVEW